jgi:HEPN domain-containing protein
MKPPEEPEVAQWLRKVGEDFRAAELLSASGDPLEDAVGFHCQQAAEKTLKAVLVASGSRPPRTHDLEELAALLPSAPIPPPEVTRALIDLTGLAVIPRYPVMATLRAPNRAERARADLEAVVAWLEGVYGWSVPRGPVRVAGQGK